MAASLILSEINSAGFEVVFEVGLVVGLQVALEVALVLGLVFVFRSWIGIVFLVLVWKSDWRSSWRSV